MVNILFLADTTHPAAAVSDHIKAITTSKKINWHVVNPLVYKTLDKMNFSLFDALGIHYSIKPYNNYYLSASLKRKIASYKGAKFLFLQDEYQRVNQVQDYLVELGFDLLFTLVSATNLDKAYPDKRLTRLKKITVLTGYASEAMKAYPAPPVAMRTVDVSYRARRCAYWLGRLAYEKQWIATEFIQQTRNQGLRLDISLEEADRLYGERWLQLLSNSKAVLGTESGTSVWDFDRQVEQKVTRFLKENKQASFEQVYEQVLKPVDGAILYNAISPRVFEAAACKTPMIMFPGEYSGVCKPDVHYIVLQKDFSNLHEVLARLKDDQFLQALADQTFEDLINSDQFSEKNFALLIEREIMQIVQQRASADRTLVVQEIKRVSQQHKQLNRIRKLLTEFYFMLSNFISIAFDPAYSVADRTRLLVKGFKRYLTYLLQR